MKPPKSASELVTMCEADWDEGVIVAYFPCPVESHYMLPEMTVSWDDKHLASPVMSDLGPWKERMLDVAVTLNPGELVDTPPPDISWQSVRDMARELKLNEVPIRWQGPISEIPDSYFKNKPGTVMGFRFWRHGPWIFPLEKAPNEDV